MCGCDSDITCFPLKFLIFPFSKKKNKKKNPSSHYNLSVCSLLRGMGFFFFLMSDKKDRRAGCFFFEGDSIKMAVCGLQL